jgi:hypothetical protein
MRIEVTLGVRYAQHQDVHVIKHASSDYAEIQLEHIFEALNRIEGLHEDVDRLRKLEIPSLCWLRESLDIAKAPSMSPEDEIKFFSDAGVLVRHVRCESIGWKEIPCSLHQTQ